MTVPGDTLISGSKYLHLCSLARGGMGEVTLAVRQEGGFRRLYAIKRLHDLYQDDVDFRKMFLDEARLAGMVRHRNVVAVLDVGEDDGGPFQVMEYVEGPSVHKLLGRLGKNAERLPAQLALDIVAQACRGLHAAHELRPLPVRVRLLRRSDRRMRTPPGAAGVRASADRRVSRCPCCRCRPRVASCQQCWRTGQPDWRWAARECADGRRGGMDPTLLKPSEDSLVGEW